jgi:cyclophilin family peptidyl-prolyl cis-trans isomerase
MRPRFSLWALLLAAMAQGAFPQGKPADAALLRGLESRDTTVLLRAIRGIGHQERPATAERLLPLLAHPLPGVRARAAEALAQAAQGFRGDSSLEGRGASWPALVNALTRRTMEERDPGVLGMLALSLGRLPYLSPSEFRDAEARLLLLSERVRDDQEAETRVARGFETLARRAARRAPLKEDALSWLRERARSPAGERRVRRHALGALLAVQAADDSTVAAALAAPDPELRRLALTGITREDSAAAIAGPVSRALADSAPMVRIEALRAWQRLAGRAACSPLAEAAHDAVPAVALVALDLLGGCGGDSLAVAALLGAGGSWHARAHALVSLARAAPGSARSLLPVASGDSTWQLRMYAARAAAELRDTAVLGRLANDRAANVREAALAGLHEVSGHGADAACLRALAARDYQLVRTAANALAGSPAREAGTSLLAALDRITAERRETSRDPRVALLARLHELGRPALAPRLLPYLTDFDPVIAESAAVILSAWTGRPARAAPRRLAVPAVSPARAERLRGARLRFHMAAGGAFDVELLVDEAPLTVVRVTDLAQRGYYNGLTFHRVVPNFVIQGGSPGANEYMGDGPYMPDELSALSHERGTLGISTRGRDTGDAQLFVNLVGNPRLDYEYTVWGRVVAGMEVVDAVLEGAVIRRVELVPR